MTHFVSSRKQPHVTSLHWGHVNQKPFGLNGYLGIFWHIHELFRHIKETLCEPGIFGNNGLQWGHASQKLLRHILAYSGGGGHD